METLAYFIIGQQTETASDIRDSIDLARRLAPNYVHFTIFCPYPGTAIYEEGLARGILERDVWREFARDPRPGFEPPVWEENFTRQELREMLVKCYKSFYMRPELSTAKRRETALVRRAQAQAPCGALGILDEPR